MAGMVLYTLHTPCSCRLPALPAHPISEQTMLCCLKNMEHMVYIPTCFKHVFRHMKKQHACVTVRRAAWKKKRANNNVNAMATWMTQRPQADIAFHWGSGKDWARHGGPLWLVFSGMQHYCPTSMYHMNMLKEKALCLLISPS